MEWQDLRILLAVARTGSVVAAGRDLAVAHTTVSRRLANHPHGAIEAVAAGFGLAVVPCFLGQARGLVQLTSPLDHDDVYVAFAADMQNVPRVRAVIDAVVDAVRQDLERLQGRAVDGGSAVHVPAQAPARLK